MTHFLHCPELSERGVEHGFGMRGSLDQPVPGLVLVRQVHGTRIVRAPLADPAAEADALWTSQTGVAVGVRTADCVPILLVHSGGRGVVAIHAGWRGSVSGIAAVAAEVFCEEIGAEPSELWAAIGPHIGVCCYEVDARVIARVSRDVLVPSRREGHAHLDLFALNRGQLRAIGVDERSIWRVPGCTACETRFDSYRRDGGGGRMVHFVRMRGPGA